MEGEIMFFRRAARIGLGSLCVLSGLLSPTVYAQEKEPGKLEDAAQLRLTKTPLKSREYKGRMVEGEEKAIKPGDTVWRYLIQEKGLPAKQFGRYLVLIGSLNPGIKDLNILRVGDTIFIPVKPDEILGIDVSAPKGQPGQPRIYRVKKGDYMFKILREQLGLQEKKEIAKAFADVKELNPRKKDWNILFVGEAVVFPGELEATKVPPADPTKPMEVVGLDYAQKLPAKDNLHLLEQVMGAVGHQAERKGEEVVALEEGRVHLDRDSYPVIHNPQSRRKVILDLDESIPPALRSRFEAQSPSTPIVALKKGASLHEAVSSVLSRMGFQSLPANRPVVVQDRGVGVQVKGEWMVTGPEQLSGAPEMFIISLTDVPGKTPEYLRSYLSLKGMNLKEILLPTSPIDSGSLPLAVGSKSGEIERWPVDKKAMVDALLRTYQATSSADQPMSVSVREGIRVDTRADRYLEIAGRKVALFFQPVGETVGRALQEKNGVSVVEMDLESLSSRQIITVLLRVIGERIAYRDNRFPAAGGASPDKVVLMVPGFYVAHRSLLLTDREIPKEIEPYFAEKGLKVVYFH